MKVVIYLLSLKERNRTADDLNYAELCNRITNTELHNFRELDRRNAFSCKGTPRRVCMGDSDKCCSYLTASVRETLVVHWGWGKSWGNV